MTVKKDAIALTSKSPVADGIAAIKKQIKALNFIQESVYLTKGIISGFPNKVENETKSEELIKMAGLVIAKELHYNTACEVLGMNPAPLFKLDGSTKDQWIADIKLRMAILTSKEKFDKLKDMEKKWNELMDKEDRKAALVAEMQEFMGTTDSGDKTEDVVAS